MTATIDRRQLAAKAWPPVPEPVIRESDVINRSSPLHVVCNLPLHFLPDVREELGRVFRVSLCYNMPREYMEECLDTADALLVNGAATFRLDGAVLQKASRLRVIVSPSTGSDHVDHEYCSTHGIQFRGLRGETETIENIHASAEGSFTLLLALLKNLPRAYDLARAGYWREVENEIRGVDLHGRKLGLVGYGRIGRKMSGYAHAFGARILAYDPHVGVTDPWVTQLTSLDALLSSADIVSAHVHLDDTTSGLFGSEAFATMKKGAYFLNTSRGAIVDEAALIDAIESGHLTAAAVDVVQGEHSDDVVLNPLVDYARTHPRLIVTPHTAGMSVDAQRHAAQWAVRQLKCFFGVEQ